MSTSVRKLVKHYVIAALGCAVFAIIYAQFSHGVYSPFMTFMFAIPLLGGAVIALGSHLAHTDPPRASRQAWALAIAALTLASCLRGIFDIAGTASPLLPVYFVAAAVFAVIGFVNMAKQPA